MRIGRLSVHYVPARFREWRLSRRHSSYVLALGPLYLRWAL